MTVLDVDIWDSPQGPAVFLVMDFVDGLNVQQLISAQNQRENISMGVRITIARDLLVGLSAIHQATHTDGSPMGLIHRDISPHNLLVGLDGRVRITDFGIAKTTAFSTPGQTAGTEAGVIKGKLAYMSPEQANGNDLTQSSDLFSAAIVIWEIFAGRPLFDGATPSAMISQLLFKPIPSLAEVLPEAPPRVGRAPGARPFP